MALNPAEREKLFADAAALQEFRYSPAWEILQRLLADEIQQAVAYLLTLTDSNAMHRQAGAIAGLNRALTIPQQVLDMARHEAERT